MSRTIERFAIAAIAALAIAGPSTAYAGKPSIVGLGHPDVVENAFIVRLKDDALANSADRSRALVETSALLLETHGGKLTHVFDRVLPGFSVIADEAAARKLAADPRVARVSAVTLGTANVPLQANPPWGLDRIDQRALPLNGYYAPMNATGAGANIYIVDSGVRRSHPDIAARMGQSINFASVRSGSGDSGGGRPQNQSDATDDDSGHGTLVASIAGGTRFGVAKASTIHSVRVSRGGRVRSDDFVAAANWLISNVRRPAVANMSLGWAGGNEDVDVATQSLLSAGIVVVAAAGNDAVDACLQSPARVAGAITVAATTRTDARAAFSNYGACVDLYAPGIDVPSADYANPAGVKLASGTSVSSPHVAGAVALQLALDPNMQPDVVSQRLRSNRGANQVLNIRFLSPGLPAPSHIFTAHTSCWGYNYVAWGAVEGAWEYELWASSTREFASPYLVLKTPATTTDVPHFPSPSHWVKARACHPAMGCGEFNRYAAMTEYYPTCD